MKKNKEIELSAVLKVLAYFQVFQYPLSKEEIAHYTKFEEEKIAVQLNSLVQEEKIFIIDGYYSLLNNPSLVRERISGSWRAKTFASKALKRANFIGKFPFVRGVYISGSFSKGVVNEGGDVDYFVISKHNRLWISRTILILYKKIFLFNSRKFFCLNYFISDQNLEISQKNIFTATELFTLIPMVNTTLHQKLLKDNKWAEDFYDFKKIKPLKVKPFKISTFQSFIELFFNGKLGERLDIHLMKKTLMRWKRKFPEMENYDFKIAFKSTRNVSKHHPSNFQKKVLEKYENNLKLIKLKNV
ncbi:MAG: nucleotidyltransferase domain-containing protein [Flavobacteriales bacterium]